MDPNKLDELIAIMSSILLAKSLGENSNLWFAKDRSGEKGLNMDSGEKVEHAIAMARLVLDEVTSDNVQRAFGFKKEKKK